MARRPSPAMAVACLALFVALGGTSIAAVNYARNAGKVDGKNAYKPSKSLARVAGDLVATKAKGPNKGRIPARFLAGVPRASTFGAAAEVTDNAVGAPAGLGNVPNIGSLSATCSDQRGAVGVEDPQTTITLANSSGTTINLAKSIGGGPRTVAPFPPNTVETIVINGSNTFEMHAQNANVNLIVDGVVRQDGRGTPTASCVFYGTVIVVS